MAVAAVNNTATVEKVVVAVDMTIANMTVANNAAAEMMERANANENDKKLFEETSEV